MPTDDPFAFLPTGQPKPVKKTTLWREKLFSKDKNKGAVPDKQIEDFLASNRPRAESPITTKADPSHPPPTVSTHRIPSSHDVSNAPPQPQPQPQPQSQRQHTATENYVAFSPTEEVHPPQIAQLSRSKTQRQQEPPQPSQLSRTKTGRTRKNKGLHVGFSDRTPEVIGEGGDESEAPTIEISWSRQRTRDRQPTQVRRAPSRSPNPSRELPNLRVDTSLGDGDISGLPQDLQSGTSPSRKPLVESSSDADLLSTLHITQPGSRLSFRSTDSHSFAERVRNQMQVEEARALHNRYDDGSSPVDDDEEYEDDDSSSPIQPSHSPQSRSPHSTHESESVYETPISHTSNAPSLKSIVHSIRHPPSPVVTRTATNLSPVDPRLPAQLTPGSTGKVSPTPPKFPSQPSQTPSPQPPQAHSQPLAREPSTRKRLDSNEASREPSRSSQPPKFSLRNVAAQVGDTAFAEFKQYIARYDSLLRLAAESVKPLMETSLVEWIRAALWWFLRGKTRLETFARTRANCPPSYAKQAVVDLAKSFWINTNIVPDHPELSRYGQQMGIDALLAVANTTGDKDMVDLLSLHQVTLNHLRSLSMSIKRNNILALIEEDDASPSHLDTSVWLRYPFFAPDVSAVLSGSAKRSMLADKPGKTPSMVYMMPLGDTSRYFSYGSMFVQASVSSSEDDTQQYAMPCCLAIIRERADWYVFAAITSQSQLVNVMIQSDRKQGPTWEDVEWQVRTHSMRVKLPRGFELDVMFKEDDFKALWNIVKYTQKSEASLAPEADESVVYENTVKVFQYMDPGTPKAFPPEPLERCRIRLFERTVTIKEGTGSRSAHRGFRLTVLTSPKVKTLSNVKHILAHGTPIVFGLLRGEDGAPALLLKVTEDGRTRSMLLTFHEVEERTKMHAILLGMIPRELESKGREIPLQAYAIEQPADQASGRSAVTHLQFPAGSVFVIDQKHSYVDHGYGPTILSENLRAFVATEWGSVTDRINLGPGELKIGLDVNRKTGMSLFRPAQQDLTVSLADNLIKPELAGQVAGFLEKVTTNPMARRLEFASMNGM
ncbi:hypothetical protein N7466_005351 [Penicillium verhagenii]|uniref:uncharacterized protein n=1 Tax=Penicillium verhagenii TaxID=1562060 RepID=UPI0025457EC6|nr:uncharacterized protein N7466_005351 [Penicillium verhagenii]KAJ5935804.1 hypothetical protein N7466_005351 [Penicillium verhagenii]